MKEVNTIEESHMYVIIFHGLSLLQFGRTQLVPARVHLVQLEIVGGLYQTDCPVPFFDGYFLLRKWPFRAGP
jgi:hypothetical protein